MGKYLTIWEADESKIPVDPKERKAAWQMAMEMTKQDMKDGKVKDWGVFLGQVRGFSISEGTEEEVQAISMKYVPFFRFQIYPLISMDQSTAIVNAM
jgi:hypothetical protein